MKTKRNLSGVFIRHLNAETNQWENICIEDLSEENRDKFLLEKSFDWNKSLVHRLCEVINNLGNEFDLHCE